jgi:hypothetical protein
MADNKKQSRAGSSLTNHQRFVASTKSHFLEFVLLLEATFALESLMFGFAFQVQCFSQSHIPIP